MLRWHRLAAAFACFLLVYVSVTGLGIQLADMRALVSGAPATDPDMLMMRQHIPGPPNYSVVSAPDYAAPPLPASLDPMAGLERAAALGRAAVPGADLRLVELRMADGKPAAHVQMGARHLIFDLASGAPIDAKFLPPEQPGRGFKSTRSTFKSFHRFLFIPWGTAINGLAAIGLTVLIVTGLIQYTRLYRQRASMKRKGLFWQGGDRWRKLHRWIALAASVPVIWLTVSGLMLSLDNVGANYHQMMTGPRAPGAFDGDQSSPITDAAIVPMARTTLAAFAREHPGVAAKVVRLRYFVGYPQGAVVAADANTSQNVFNAQTGKRMTMWEPGYPDLSFPTGWQLHQELKQFHRGDLFGMGGRWLALLGGLSLCYLSISGCVMYLQLYRRRRQSGRKRWIWK